MGAGYRSGQTIKSNSLTPAKGCSSFSSKQPSWNWASPAVPPYLFHSRKKRGTVLEFNLLQALPMPFLPSTCKYRPLFQH